MLKFQLLFPTTRTQPLPKSINDCKQRTSVAGTTKQEAGSRKTKTFAVSAESDKRTAWKRVFTWCRLRRRPGGRRERFQALGILPRRSGARQAAHLPVSEHYLTNAS